MAQDLFDVTILAGALGLYAAYYAGFRTLRTRSWRASTPRRQVTALYPEKWIYMSRDSPRSRPGADRQPHRPAMQYKPTLCLGETVAR